MENYISKIFDLRNFYFYQSGNSFTGSLDSFSYKIIPDKETLTAMIWHGMLCSDLAEIEQQKEFPLSQEGFNDMVKWLEDTYQKTTDA